MLDLCCGTGANFPTLEEAVGPGGQILGVDRSASMLTLARERVMRAEGRTVTLVQADAETFAAEYRFAAAVSTLDFGYLDSPRGALERMTAAVVPGGRVLIADIKLSERAEGLSLNPLLWALSVLWIPRGRRKAYLLRQPWKELERLVDAFGYVERLGGIIYLAWGNLPGASPATS